MNVFVHQLAKQAGATLLALALLLGACGSDADPAEGPTADDPAFDDALWGEEFAVGANRGGVMSVDDDLFRLGVISVDGDSSQLEVIHSIDRDENRVETVEQGSRFIVGDYRIRVGTVDGDEIVALWTKRVGS